jgi:hypothetical protein
MWSAISASVIGTSHEAIGAPCQDACQLLRMRFEQEDLLIAAVADGAGSVPHSQIGSSEAVQRVVQLVSQGGFTPGSLDAQQLKGWYQEVLDHLGGVAKREALPLHELACTLLLAIVWRDGAVLGQIGDGAWVVEKDGTFLAGTWPETGEYANVTVFLTTEGALDHLQFRRLEGKVSGIAGFTDGIQSLALDYAQRVPAARFFNAVLSPLRDGKDETELIAPLRLLLSSELISSRTDDDKTLLIAVWRDADTMVEGEKKGFAEAKHVETGSGEAKSGTLKPAEIGRPDGTPQ